MSLMDSYRRFTGGEAGIADAAIRERERREADRLALIHAATRPPGKVTYTVVNGPDGQRLRVGRGYGKCGADWTLVALDPADINCPDCREAGAR